MPDTLTESFCERCGTRYEFKAPTRLNSLRKTRGLFGGLKNYLTSQDDLSDAIGDAMRSEEERLAAAQLEAFHESFNFCIGCRQYTCLNCWNDGSGRCRSCAPIPGTDDLAERFAASFAGNGASAVAEPPAAAVPADDVTLGDDDLQRRLGLDAWPSTDMPIGQPATNGHAASSWPTSDVLPTAEPEPEEIAAELERLVAEPPDEDATVAPIAEAEVLAEAEAVAEPEWPAPEPAGEAVPIEAVAAEALEPEATEEPFAAETVYQPVSGELEYEPMVEADLEPETAWTAEPEPVVAEVEPEPEPVAAEVEPEPEPIVADVELESDPLVAEVEPEPEPLVAEVEPERPLLRVVSWEEDAAYEVLEPEPVFAEEPEAVAAAEFDAEQVVAEPEPEPEPLVAEAPEPEPEPIAAEVEPEPPLAELQPEPEPVAAAEAEPIAELEPAPRIRPITETILHFPSQPTPTPAPEADEPAAAEIDDPEVAARRAQLDLLGLGDPGQGPVTPTRPASLPYRSRGAAPSPIELAARSSFWEASAREVADAAAQIGVQNCGECGLSLSASARFCRRCGTRQARSA